MSRTWEVNTKKPIPFNDIGGAVFRTIEESYPELSYSLKNELRPKGLETMVNVFRKLNSGARKRNIATMDATTESKKSDYIREKRQLWIEKARNRTVHDPDIEKTLPGVISTAIQTLGLAKKIPVDQSGRLIAPSDDVVSYRGKEYKTWYEKTGNAKFLTTNMLNGLLSQQAPWTSLRDPRKINRIPEIKLLRAYIRFGNSPRFVQEMNKVARVRAQISNPEILARRIVSKLKKNPANLEKGKGATAEELRKYITPSDNANYNVMQKTLTTDNMNDIDNVNYKKFSGFYKDLLLKGKINGAAKEFLTKEMRVLTKDQTEGVFDFGL